MKPKVLGIITARGGSKGIPEKNIKLFLGKPLIWYTIDAALRSKAFDRLIISTDDEKIAQVAKQYGCEVPFMRPRELAEDTALGLEVLRHATKWLKESENYYPDYSMVLQPTSPLRQPFHIQEAINLIVESSADSVLSVAEIPKCFTPYKAMVSRADGSLELFNGAPIKDRPSRRQDIRETYWSTGLIYLFKTSFLFNASKPSLYGEKVAPYLIGGEYAIDIDLPQDWTLAELRMKELQQAQNEKK